MLPKPHFSARPCRSRAGTQSIPCFRFQQKTAPLPPRKTLFILYSIVIRRNGHCFHAVVLYPASCVELHCILWSEKLYFKKLRKKSSVGMESMQAARRGWVKGDGVRSRTRILLLLNVHVSIPITTMLFRLTPPTPDRNSQSLLRITISLY